MVYKGVYRDGVVVLEDATGLRNGTVVEVLRPTRRKVTPRRTSPKVTVKPVKRRRKKVEDPLLGLVGLWKDRPDWKGKTTLEIAAELRAKALGGRRGG